jgi:hypothetical protein
MTTKNTQYAFLTPLATGDIEYASFQASDFGVFLRVVRDRREEVARVTTVRFDEELDSAEKSGAVEFIREYRIAIDAEGITDEVC